MEPRKLIVVALLSFVAATFSVNVAKSIRPQQSTRSATLEAPVTVPAKDASHFVAAYFHGDTRCRTCKAIEAQSHEAIMTVFADRLSAGDLEWRLVNFDQEENAHFREDFQLASQSLVLIEERGGKIVRWKNLPDVWIKIHENPEDFEEYIVENTSDFLVDDAT